MIYSTRAVSATWPLQRIEYSFANQLAGSKRHEALAKNNLAQASLASEGVLKRSNPVSEPITITGGKGKATLLHKGDLIKITNIYGSQVSLYLSELLMEAGKL